jgi:hypothetical protein
LLKRWDDSLSMMSNNFSNVLLIFLYLWNKSSAIPL